MAIINFFIELLRDPMGIVGGWINQFGAIWVYAPLFAIIFCETGLVFTPFLPGDSLLITAGFFAHGGGLNLWVLLAVVIAAAILGDTCNYFIGREFGTALIKSKRVKVLKPEYIQRTEAFFDKHGGKSLFLARFFPIIRTFAPFMAGVGKMPVRKFWHYNILGGVVWSTAFTLIGYFFGGIPWVQHNFETIVIVIIVVSFLPSIIGVVRERLKKREEKQPEEVEEFLESALLESPDTIEEHKKEREVLASRYGHDPAPEKNSPRAAGAGVVSGRSASASHNESSAAGKNAVANDHDQGEA